MPVFNAEDYLESSLQSLLAQNYPNLEIIITDNGSTDRTSAICKVIAAQDRRIRYHRNPENLGVFGNFNKAFELSKGDFFMWAGAHDLWDPNFISACLQKLLLYPNAVLCAGEYHEIDERGKFLKIIPVYPETEGLSSADRLRWVVKDLGSCFAVYSLMRRESLMKTARFVNKFGADTILVAQLSLLGTFVRTSARIYMRAFLDRRYTTDENVIRILGERNVRTRDKAFPYSQQMLELMDVIHHAPLSLGEKVSLFFDTFYQWKGVALKELALNSAPASISRVVKRIFAK